jgi:N-glycosylase/DNA lyase
VFPESTASPEVEAARDAETLLWLKDYFQLDVDLVKLYDEWGEKDHVFAKLRGRFEGIRMLRQDPWENLISCASVLLVLLGSAHSSL